MIKIAKKSIYRGANGKFLSFELDIPNRHFELRHTINLSNNSPNKIDGELVNRYFKKIAKFVIDINKKMIYVYPQRVAEEISICVDSPDWKLLRYFIMLCIENTTEERIDFGNTETNESKTELLCYDYISYLADNRFCFGLTLTDESFDKLLKAFAEKES